VTPIIIGAGLSGLIAAHAWPKAKIHEASPTARDNHKAVLRFRGEQVSALTGIPFRKITVRKAIYSGGMFVEPSIRHANRYAYKVAGRIIDRSIWNLEPAERYVAPDDLVARLLENVGDRVVWGSTFDGWRSGLPVVSTIPMPTLLAALGDFNLEIVGQNFNFAPIQVRRYKIPDCDTFQTIYFPDPKLTLYRATITGNTLIAESVIPETTASSAFEKTDEAEFLEQVFGIRGLILQTDTFQKYGKIAPIDDKRRREGIHRLSEEFNIYSLGRFATWRNILLDDLIGDIAAIKSLMSGDKYQRKLSR
jgi:hypothetical protein